jgi:hypothetical protein
MKLNGVIKNSITKLESAELYSTCFACKYHKGKRYMSLRPCLAIDKGWAGLLSILMRRWTIIVEVVRIKKGYARLPPQPK